MHRFVWDLHYTAPNSTRHEYPIAAIPHNTPRYPLGPTALPGSFTVRLAVDGKTSTAPLTVKMDPRVKTPAAGLEKKFQAETRMAAVMTDSAQAVLQGRSIQAQLEKLSAEASASIKDALEASEKKLTALLGAPAGFLAPPSADITLSRVNGEASTLYQQVWQVDAEPTASQMQALTQTEHDGTDVLKRWNDFKATDLPALNRLLRESKVPEVNLQADLYQDEPQIDEE
jgi:hypothetical protein